MTGLTRDARGRRAELAARLFLMLKGYRILAQRFRAGQGEIDLVARKGAVLAFIEVKYRPSRRAGLESVSPRQQSRIAGAARAYLAQHPRLFALTRRFDIVVISPWVWPAHVLNAWSVSEDNRR